MNIDFKEIKCPKCYSEFYVLPSSVKDTGSKEEYYCFACDKHFTLKQAFVVINKYELSV